MYQINPVLPYAFSAGIYIILLVFMQWIGRRVTIHSNQDEPGQRKRP